MAETPAQAHFAAEVVSATALGPVASGFEDSAPTATAHYSEPAEACQETHVACDCQEKKAISDAEDSQKENLDHILVARPIQPHDVLARGGGYHVVNVHSS